jgi:hypothetical protein
VSAASLGGRESASRCATPCASAAGDSLPAGAVGDWLCAEDDSEGDAEISPPNNGILVFVDIQFCH